MACEVANAFSMAKSSKIVTQKGYRLLIVEVRIFILFGYKVVTFMAVLVTRCKK
jgi:hypothetical protein